MASITRRPDDRWRARYRDETGREHAKHFARKVDGQRWLDEVTAAVITGRYVDPREARTTFAAYFTEWSQRQVWETTTVAAMRLAAGSVSFGDVRLGQLRRSHLESWVKTMTMAGLAPGTIRTRFNNVRGVLRAAVRDRMLSEDPSVGITLPRDRRREAAMTLPTAGEVGAILAAAEPHFRQFVAVCAFAGLRLGEAAGLQVGDVDFLGRRIQVLRQVQRAPGGVLEVRSPKYGSERAVFAADALLEQLSRHVATYRAGGARERWLFTAASGDGQSPLHQNSVGYLWRKACLRAGVEGHTLHDLRHWHASGLIAAGCDVVTVQRALGHRSPNVTLRTYAHIWPTAEDRTRAAAAGLLASTAAAAAGGPADYLRTAGGPQGL